MTLPGLRYRFGLWNLGSLGRRTLHARPDWLQQRFLHIGGRSHSGHHRRPKLYRWVLDERGFQLDGAQVIVEVVPLTAVQRIAAQADSGTALLPRTRSAKVMPEI